MHHHLDELPDGPRIGRPAAQRARAGKTSIPPETLIECVLAGEELHNSTRDLAMFGWSLEQLQELMQRSAAKSERPDDWEKRYRNLPKLVKSAHKKRMAEAAQAFRDPPTAAPVNDGTPAPFVFPGAIELPIMRPADFAARPLVDREWIIQDLIPRYEPTLLFGAGATGKSLLLLQLCICMAAGLKWLERDVPPGRAMMFTCEDSTDEINRRASAVLKILGIGWEALGDRLAIIPMRDVEADAVLATEHGGVLQTTPTYDALKRAVADFAPDLVVIDTLADAFAGDENVRAQAKQFVGRVSRLRGQTTYMVTAHPSVSGMADGRGASGSTGWPAAVRSHLFFGRVMDGEDEPDTDVRRLVSLKANYARKGAGEIEILYQDGAFTATDGGSARIFKAADAERVFLEMLAAWNAGGNYVNASGGGTYAPRVFADTKQAKDARLSKRNLKEAMTRLIAAGTVESATRRANGRDVSYLRVKETD